MASGTHNLAVVLSGNSSSLRTALLSAGRDLKAFEKNVEGTSTKAGRLGALMSAGLKVGVLAVGAAMAYSVVQAAALDTELRNLQSITKQTDTEIAAVGKTLVGMSTELPQSAKTLAEGLYNIASSGFQGAEGLKVLEASAVAASAGLTTTEVSAKAITSVLNAYGRSASDATDVSDILFQAVNVGVVTFEELAGTIGDVVGTAAAATVEIDEVSSAIATMTLSGISAAEAGTSLNRLIQSLIDPSEELSKALQDLGYESGAAALEEDKLSVVMLKLMDASQGNIETLLKWFPEIRAARGALALMSAEGRNYLEVVAAIEVKENRANASRKALNEQLKAASAQWQLFKNRVNAAAITVGTQLLPVVIGAMHGMEDLARHGVAVLQEGLERLEPFFRNVWNIGEDVVKMLGVLLETAGPVAGALGAIAALGIITFLNGLAAALEATTGFLADHPGLVKAVAVVLAAVYLPAVLTATGATVAGSLANLKYAASFKLLQAQELLGNIMARLSAFGGGIAALTSQMGGGVSATAKFKEAFKGLGPSLAVGGALVAVTMAVQAYGDEMGKARKKAEEWADSFRGDFDPAKATLGELENEIGRITDAAEQWDEAADNAWNPFKEGSSKKARDEMRETAAGYEELRDNAMMLRDELGVTAERALELAQNEEFMAGATDHATGKLDEEAAAALEAQEALAELSDQLRAMYDPFFGLQDAAGKLAEAQWNAAIAAGEHGAKSKEAIEANREAVRAAVDYQAALADLKAAIADGSTNLETAIATLYGWVDAGVLTEEQARQSERELRGLGATADATDGKNVIVKAHAETEDAKERLAAFRRYIDSIPKTVTVTVNGVTGTRPNVDYRTSRWGGIHSYAAGGIHAHVAKGDLIRYAEPETGGEAFIPKRGDARRSSAILAEAASWYGYHLVRMASGGVSVYGGGDSARRGAPAPVVVRVDGTGVDRALLEWLRRSIRVEGGGNVQVALGQAR